jgi:hypothetical protein
VSIVMSHSERTFRGEKAQKVSLIGGREDERLFIHRDLPGQLWCMERTVPTDCAIDLGLFETRDTIGLTNYYVSSV